MILYQINMEKDKVQREKQKLRFILDEKKSEASELQEKMTNKGSFTMDRIVRTTFGFSRSCRVLWQWNPSSIASVDTDKLFSYIESSASDGVIAEVSRFLLVNGSSSVSFQREERRSSSSEIREKTRPEGDV